MKQIIVLVVMVCMMAIVGCASDESETPLTEATNPDLSGERLHTKHFVMELPINPDDSDLIEASPKRAMMRKSAESTDAPRIMKRVDPDPNWDLDWTQMTDTDGDNWPDVYDYDVYGTGYFDLIIPEIKEYNPEGWAYQMEGRDFDVVDSTHLRPVGHSRSELDTVKSIMVGESYYFHTQSRTVDQTSGNSISGLGYTGNWDFGATDDSVVITHKKAHGEMIVTAQNDDGVYPRSFAMHYNGEDYNGAIGGSYNMNIVRDPVDVPTINSILFNGEEVTFDEPMIVDFQSLPEQTPIQVIGSFTNVTWECTSGAMSSGDTDGTWIWDAGYDSKALLLITVENADGVMLQRKVLIYQPVPCTQEPLATPND